MKKVGEIMKDMGFNSESSEETQKAFIKYLLRVANKNKHVPEPFFSAESQEQDEWQELKIHSKGHKKDEKSAVQQKQEQLSFPFLDKKEGSEAS